MGKLGAFSYPEISLDEAIGIVAIVATRLKGRVSRRGLALVLNQSELSGWLSHKLAALRDFGLVEGRGEGQLTPLAQRLAFPTDEEEAKRAKSEAYGKVALFRTLEGRFHREVPDPAALTLALEQLTETPRFKVMKRVGLIRKHLADAATVRGRPSPAQVRERLTETLAREGIAQAEGRETTTLEGMREPPAVADTLQRGDAKGRSEGQAQRGPLRTPPTLEIAIGEMRMAAPLTDETLDIAISLLEGLRRR